MTSTTLFVLLGSALIPLVMGFLYYNPKTMGNIWMKESGMTPEKGKNMNMPLVFGLMYLFSLFLAFMLFGITVHQSAVFSIFADLKNNTEAMADKDLFLQKYDTLYRTFKHGAFHGFLSGIFLGFPLIGVNAFFEAKSFKYILIHVAYWTISMMLMGGVICAFA